MEAETCSKNAIIPVCVPVNGISEQHQILSGTLALQKLGKLLGSQVTPLMLARSLKHHMAATAASHRV